MVLILFGFLRTGEALYARHVCTQTPARGWRFALLVLRAWLAAMDLKARVKKYASPGRSKDKANRDTKAKPSTDDENDSDKKSIFSSASKSPVRVFIREQLHRKSSTIGTPKNSPSAKAPTNGSTPKKSPKSKISMLDVSPLSAKRAPAVPAKDSLLTIPTSTSTHTPGEPTSPVSMEIPRIETAVAVKLEKVSPQQSPDTATPNSEPPELNADNLQATDASPPIPPPNDLKSPASFPKRYSSLGQSGQPTHPLTITESLSEDETLVVEDRKDSVQDSDETSLQNGDVPVSTESAENEKAEAEAEAPTRVDLASVVKRKGRVDELLVTSFLILLLVFIFYNPFFDVPHVKVPTLEAFR
ncbi:hypothetical protein EG327_005857 [Venturia inaequalis]|uniref:Uncharacterized protein n=1 Tax=Venturia inaequalis TaxID=5025 RepID=A0A8H3ZBD3_VENIN|nr:hypothetical protein EG327_005857 [Venturia inaequalis]